MQNACFVVTVSDYNCEYLNALLAEYSCHSNVQRLYNGLDLNIFRPSKKKGRTGVDRKHWPVSPQKRAEFPD